MTVHLLRGADPALLADGVSELVQQLVGDDDRALVVDDISDETYEAARIVDAARTPPFLTSKRVVVARHIEQFTRQDDVAPLVEYLADPLDTTELVLVASGTVHKALVEAVKKTGHTVDTDPGHATKEWLEGQFKEAGVKLDQAARELVVEQLGEDLGRLPALLDGLEATYGPGARLSEDDVEPFLGEAGGVPPWELTDAIDRGDTAAALDRLTRMMGGGERHPLQIMATLSRPLRPYAALDGQRCDRREVGGRPARHARLDVPGPQGARSGAAARSARVWRGPIELLAGADLDLRGAASGPTTWCWRCWWPAWLAPRTAPGGRRPARTARRPASSCRRLLRRAAWFLWMTPLAAALSRRFWPAAPAASASSPPLDGRDGAP